MAALQTVSPQQWPQLVASDPQLQQLLKTGANVWGNVRPAVQQYLNSKGLTIDDQFTIDGKTGQMVEGDKSGWDAFTHYGLPALGIALTSGLAGAALAGGAGAAGAAGAGGTAASAAPAGTVGAIADPGILAGGVPASIASGAAAPVATNLGTGALETVGAVGGAGATAGTSLWKTLAAPLIGAGTNVAGSLIQANQQSKATDAQLQAAREAEAFLKQKYAQTQAQVAPYIASGQGALASLDTGLGIKLPQGTAINPQGGFMTQPFTSPSGDSMVPITNPATSANNGQTVTGQLPAGYTQPSLAALAQNQPSVAPAKTGETRIINGQQAQWDGQGWKAV